MRKKIKHFTGILIVMFFVLFITEHILFVSLAKSAIKYITALDIQMNSVSVNPFKTRMTIRGLKIFNPLGFKEPMLAHIPLVMIDIHPKSFIEKGAFFNRIIVHIKQLNIIRNKDDIVNLSKMKILTPREKQKNKTPFAIDHYAINIEKVKYVDYTKEEKDRVREIDINVEEEYKNVKNQAL